MQCKHTQKHKLTICETNKQTNTHHDHEKKKKQIWSTESLTVLHMMINTKNQQTRSLQPHKHTNTQQQTQKTRTSHTYIMHRHHTQTAHTHIMHRDITHTSHTHHGISKEHTKSTSTNTNQHTYTHHTHTYTHETTHTHMNHIRHSLGTLASGNTL